MKTCENIQLSEHDYINEIEKLALKEAEGTITKKEYQEQLAKINTKTNW